MRFISWLYWDLVYKRDVTAFLHYICYIWGLISYNMSRKSLLRCQGDGWVPVLLSGATCSLSASSRRVQLLWGPHVQSSAAALCVAALRGGHRRQRARHCVAHKIQPLQPGTWSRRQPCWRFRLLYPPPGDWPLFHLLFYRISRNYRTPPTYFWTTQSFPIHLGTC